MATTPISAASQQLNVDSQPRPATVPCRTIQNYGRTLAWTFAAVALCGLGYVVEKYVFLRGGNLHGIGLPIRWAPLTPIANDAPYRLFKNPAELPMRLFGIPHILIGTLFLLSSKRMKGVKSIGQLAGLLGLSVVFCWLFYEFGRRNNPPGVETNPLALLFFYFYFLIHGFRDEAFFYKAFGDMPKEAGKTHDRLMIVLQVLFLGVLGSLIIPGYILYAEYKPEFRHPLLEAMFPADWSYLLRFAVLLVPMLAAAAVALWRIGRSFPDGLAGLWRAHHPIITIFLMSTAIILLPLATGPWTFNVVVLMHFVAWYLFGRYRLGTIPPSPSAASSGPGTAGATVAGGAISTTGAIGKNGPSGTTGSPIGPAASFTSAAVLQQPSRPASWSPSAIWKWMRTTRIGFTWLHIGLAVVVVLLAALSSYAFGKSDWIEVFMGSKAFFYWTIVHVTLSFFPR